MNYSRLFVFTLLIITGCREEVSLVFSSEVFTEQDLHICQNEPCSEVIIDYPVASGDVSVSEKINSAIESRIIDGLFLGEDDNPWAKNIPEAATQFIMAYRDYQPDLPSELDPGGYEADISIENTHQTETLVCFRCYKYLFTGGAHGYGGISFLFFDAETGESLDLEALVSDYSEFEKFAETRFREQFDVPTSGSINATGFLFEDDKFYLPEAVGIVEDKMVLIYNPYEIASYADGPITLEIQLDEIQNYINSDLL